MIWTDLPPLLCTADAARYCGFQTLSALRKARMLGRVRAAGRRGGTGTLMWEVTELDRFLGRAPKTPPELSADRPVVQGTVYFVEGVGTNRVKIGWTKRDVRERLSDLLTGCPVPLRLLGTKPGPQYEETRIHVLFVADRIRGSEWFELTPEIVAFVAGLA